VKLAFVDLETSGLDPLTHEIIEAAVIVERATDGKVVAEFECSLPFDESRANPKALEINGWGKREFPPQVKPSKVVARVASLTDGALFIGNCPWFDDAFLKALFREHDQKPGWHYHLVDVENLIAGKLGLAPPWDSKRVSEAVGVPVPTDQHGAMPDARWSRELYHAALDR
jgi:DNA polymerase III alpha subunit (gram-positive type)